jgi:hypothetical protein
MLIVVFLGIGFRGAVIKAETITKWKDWEIVIVFSLPDALFHFVCSMAGFLAILVAKDLYQSSLTVRATGC